MPIEQTLIFEQWFLGAGECKNGKSFAISYCSSLGVEVVFATVHCSVYLLLLFAFYAFFKSQLQNWLRFSGNASTNVYIVLERKFLMHERLTLFDVRLKYERCSVNVLYIEYYYKRHFIAFNIWNTFFFSKFMCLKCSCAIEKDVENFIVEEFLHHYRREIPLVRKQSDEICAHEEKTQQQFESRRFFWEIYHSRW